MRNAGDVWPAIGERDVWGSLATVSEIVRRMGTPPGQRTLILISPGFLALTAESMMEKSKVLDLAAQSNVTIRALDARGLYTTEVDASERGGSSALDLATGQHPQYQSETMKLDEDVMSELADGTGGTYFHNSNDLKGDSKLLRRPQNRCTCSSFRLEKVKQDGAYHRLKVKVDQDGLKVQARRGYFAPAPPKNKKQSWTPVLSLSVKSG